MVKRFRYMIMLAILLSGVLRVQAQFAMPDKVCIGTTRNYWVVGLPGSIYTWKINGVMQSSTLETIDIVWSATGTFTVEVQEHQDHCDGDMQSGTVTVIDKPQLLTQTDVVACDSYILPKISGTNLSGNESYYDNSQALGGKKIAGPITASQMIWIYDETGTTPNCSDETSFKITIYKTPLLVTPPDMVVCDSYSLPKISGTNLSGNESYYDNSHANGGKLIVGPVTESQTVWIYDEAASGSGCSAETSFKVTIVPSPMLDKPGTQYACNSYSLLPVTGKNLSVNAAYYDNSQAQGGKKITGPITSSRKIWIYDETGTTPNCSDETSFDVVIIIPPIAFAGSPATICPGIAYTLSGATAENYSTLLWTSAGDGTFDDATLLHPTYTPGANDLQAGTVTLTFTAEGLGKIATCAPAVSTVKLTVIKLEAVVTGTDVTCFGAKNGIITISGPAGGSGSYEYNIGTGWTTLTEYKNLGPGIYSVQMLDVLIPACIINLDKIEIKEPDPLIAITVFTDATCLGNDGTISVIDPKGGSGSYEYALNGTDWTTSGYFTNLSPATYVVWINDANVLNCKAIAGTIVIKMPEPLTAKVSQTNVSCFGGNDGIITISEPKNGSGSYEFSIDGSNWITGLVFGNLNAATYTVQMRELNVIACVETIASITITQPEQLQAIATSTNVSCFGSKDGSISILNPKGGSGSYQFTIDGTTWSNSLNYTNLGPGTYTVLIQDLNVPGCMVPVAKIIITEPPQLTAEITSADITCYGASDGIITISNPKNGLAPYQYSIDGSIWKVTGSFTGLGPTVYTVQLLDAKGCKETIGTIQIIEPLPLNADIAWTNATCLGNDGTITITNPLNSRSGLYEYNIGGTKWFTDGLFTGLAANTFIVRIRDAKLITCERTIKAVTIAAPAPLLATAVKTNATCFGANDGTITVTSQTGGSGLYEYSVDGTLWTSLPSFTGLAPVNYTLYMRDANATVCIVTVGFYDITQPELLSATATPNDVTCFKGSDGSISITSPKGGSGTYEYSVNGTDWIKGNPGGLIAGTYSVQMRDAAAQKCMVFLNPVEIKQPKQLVATVTSTDVTCFGGNDGSVTITRPTNGKEPYKYSLDGGITWQADGTFIGLKANTYNLVIIQDANSCKAPLDAVVIGQPAKLEAQASATNETLPGAKDGTITIIGQKGGSGIYDYSIDGSTWQIASVFTGLAPATYHVQVRDANAEGCMISLSVNIFPAGSLTATFTSEKVTCNGGSDGSITFANASGTTNYEYSITGGSVWQSNEYFGGLTAQTYTLMVRDYDLQTNSTVLGTIEITQPSVLEATVTVTNETFAGANDGILSVNSITGGSGVFEYSIDGINWLPTGVFTGQTSGTYDVRIRDKISPVCMISVQKVIQPAGSLSADVSQTSVGCNGSKTGKITISNASGGSVNYEYTIDNGVSWQSSGNFTGLASGNYDVMLRDSITPANKISLGKVNITQPQKLIATYNNYVPPLCAGGSGSITISALGGIPPYQGTGNFTIPSGIGDVYKKYIVSDKNECTAEISFMISNPEKIVANGVISPPLCYDAEGTITVSATGGTGALFGVGTFKVQAGKSYSFKVTDKNGCQSNVISGQMPSGSGKIIVTVTPSIPLCSGGNAKVTVSASGGLAPYTGIGTFNVAEGLHSYTITDANGCSSVGSIDISLIEPPIAPTLSVTPPNCAVTTGTITVTALSPGVSYTLTGTNPVVAAVTNLTGVFDKLKPGVYEVTATNAAGCISAAVSQTIEVQPITPATPTASVTIQPTCTQPTGTITVNAPANGLDISYTVTGTNPVVAEVTNATGSFAGLAPGVYAVTTTIAGCVSPATPLTVNPAPGAPSAPTASVTQLTCIIPSGTITVTAPATGIGISYTVTGTNPVVAAVTNATGIFSGLAPGIYAVTTTHTGCVSPAIPLTVNPVPVTPEAPTASVTTQPTCIIPTGTITVTAPATGIGISYTVTGTNPVVAAVTNATGIFAGLAPGDYALTTTIAGCASPATPLTVNPVMGTPDAPIAGLTIKPTCLVPTATIVITVPQEGTGFEYSIDGGIYQPTATFNGLITGPHQLKVKELLTGCESAVTSLTVNAVPGAPGAPTASAIKPTCIVPTGTIEVTEPKEGTGFEYSMDGFPYQASATFASLTPESIHRIKVKDISTGCESLETAITVEPISANPDVPVAIVPKVPTCNNLDGTIEFTEPTGTGFEYSIDGGANYLPSTIFTNQKTDHYILRVKDISTGCESDLGSIDVPAIPPAPTLTLAGIENCLCYDGKGSISFSTDASDGIYTILHDKGQFTNVKVISGKAKVEAPADTYTNLTIEANGCTSDPIPVVTVSQPDQIVITESIVEIDLKSQRKGAIDIIMTGGTGPYSFKWSNGSITQNIKDLSEGSYTIIVTDKNGCLAEKLIKIPVPNYPPVAVKDDFTVSCGTVSGNLLNDNGYGKDYDPENDPILLELTLARNPAHGAVTLNPDQSGLFEYVPEPGYSGIDTFRYVISDTKQNLSNAALVTIHIISDFDSDGIPDDIDQDADGDGILNVDEVMPGEDWKTADSDGDGHPNWLDIDSDNDGIVDNIEAQVSGSGYIPPTGIVNQSGPLIGVDYAYDPAHGGKKLIPIDTDKDGIPDFLDTDSDNDGVPDYIEGNDDNHDGHPDFVMLSGKDDDGDGLDNVFDTVDKCASPATNVIGSNAPLQDTDGDGIRDWRDNNDDGDQWLTVYEDWNGDGIYWNDDSNHNGVPDYLDPLSDCVLFIPDAFSPNGDNIHDYFMIYCLQNYPNAKMYIFDQLGNKLYEKNNYGNLDVWKTPDQAWWDGRTTNRSVATNNGMVIPGTYFYVLQLGNGEVKKSYVFVSY